MNATKTMNRVVYFEIPVDDMARAQDFYSIFGWSMNGAPDMDYICASTTPVDEDQKPIEPGAINGGMLKRTDKIKHPIIAIEVDSIENYVKQVIAKGGSLIMEKFQIGDMGCYCYVSDPEGNILGLWEPL